MRNHTVTESGLALRVARAVAIGLSVCALGLNAWSAAWPHAPQMRAERSVSARSRPSSARVDAAAITRPTHTATDSHAAQTADAASAVLLLRFRDAPDDDLSELAQALAKLPDPRARQALIVAARSTRAALRSAAFEALSTLDGDDVRDFMLAQLSGPNAGSSVLYFADCREPRAVPALERLARDVPADQRRAVVDALAAQGEAAQPAIERLLRGDEEACDAVLETRPLSVAMRRAVRQASVERLRAGAISGGSAFDFLEQDLARESRDALVDAAHEPASADRALHALSTRGDRSSLEALNRLGRDADRGLSARAACISSSEPDSRTRRFAPRG